MQRLNSFPSSHRFAIKSLLSFFSSLSETPNANPFFFNYLNETLNIPKSRALVISNKYPRVKSLERPETVCRFFHGVGFSDTHIRLTVSSRPEFLFCDVDKILKPKTEFFQHLGLVGSDLGKFISKTPLLFAVSLENKLIPCIEVIKKMVDDTNNKDIICAVRRCFWILTRDPEKSGLVRNIEYLKSCGIVGSQLSMLLVREPRLFCLEESKLRGLVSRVLEMGFPTNSRMFVYGLHALNCVSKETVDRKLEFLRSYGFSKMEFKTMVRKAPALLYASEERLKLGLDFFLKKIKFEKALLVQSPVCLMCSIENRVIPRYRVFQFLISRRIVKKELRFPSMLLVNEENFIKKFVLRFGDDAEELLLTYKGKKLGSSSEVEC